MTVVVNTGCVCVWGGGRGVNGFVFLSLFVVVVLSVVMVVFSLSL